MNQPLLRRRRALGAAALLAAVSVAAGLTVAGAAPVQRQAAASVNAADASAVVAISPVRVLDTRPAPNGPIGVPSPRPMEQGEVLDVALTAPSGPLPAGANSAILNITLDDDAAAKSFLTVWPSGEPRPFTSANNAEPGLVSPNSMIAKLGANGSISIFNQQGATNVVVDVVGYLVALDDVAGAGGNFSAGPGGPPANAGADGDYWYDTNTGDIYGPKAGGVWPPTPISFGGGLNGAYNARGTLGLGLILAPTAVPFAGGSEVALGNGVTPNAARDAFSIADAGVYRVSYDINTTGAAGGDLTIFVNGAAATAPAPVTAAGQSDEALLALNAGDTVQIVAGTGATITGPGSVMFEQLS